MLLIAFCLLEIQPDHHLPGRHRHALWSRHPLQHSPLWKVSPRHSGDRAERTMLRWYFGRYFCQIVTSLVVCLLSASIYNFVLVNLDRLLVFKRPFNQLSGGSRKNIKIGTLGIKDNWVQYMYNQSIILLIFLFLGVDIFNCSCKSMRLQTVIDCQSCQLYNVSRLHQHICQFIK